MRIISEAQGWGRRQFEKEKIVKKQDAALK
jgi:hypothetical protein